MKQKTDCCLLLHIFMVPVKTIIREGVWELATLLVSRRVLVMSWICCRFENDLFLDWHGFLIWNINDPLDFMFLLQDR